MSDEVDLLRRYAEKGDQQAFRELVQGTIHFVYARALRYCHGNHALAQDVTQLVFTDLARRAAEIMRHPALLGWLLTATRYAAAKRVRTEARRIQREQRAVALDTLLHDDGPSIDWSKVEPVLDDALNELGERDRAALLLRFFQNKTLGEVGAALRLSETAARSRVDRALARLRAQLARRGIRSTSAALSLAIANQVTAAAPAGLAATVSSTALAQSALPGAALIPYFTTAKLVLTTAAAILVVEAAVATKEIKTRRELQSTSQSRFHSIAPVVSGASTGPISTQSANASKSDLAAEIKRLETRAAQLRARPAGVVDRNLVAPREVGQANARDAMQTLTAALSRHDISTLEKFVYIRKSAAEREAYMAQFAPAIRAHYPTPEALLIAATFNPFFRDPPVAQQILSTHGYSVGVQTVTAWTRLASGIERADTLPFEETPDGWALASASRPPVEALRAQFDPQTGEVLAKKP